MTARSSTKWTAMHPYQLPSTAGAVVSLLRHLKSLSFPVTHATHVGDTGCMQLELVAIRPAMPHNAQHRGQLGIRVYSHSPRPSSSCLHTTWVCLGDLHATLVCLGDLRATWVCP